MIKLLARLFHGKERPLKRYYVEWPMQSGWGVMIGQDVVEAHSASEVATRRPKSAYANYDTGYYERISEVPDKIKDLSTEEVIAWFDKQE